MKAESLSELKVVYLDGVRRDLELLRRSLAELEADPQAERPLAILKRRAHQLKGSGGSYGYPRISRIASRMERLLQEERPSAGALAGLGELLHRLEEELALAEGGLEREREDAPVQQGRGRVAIIDDDPHLLQLVKEHLRRAGFVVTALQAPTQALEMLHEARPDLLLLDIEMPGQNGIEICQALRSRQEFQTLPIFFLTSKGEEEMKVKGLEVGADDYITKPFSPDELIARIAARLERNRIMMELANRDGLTGLYNHRYFQEQLRKAIEQSKRYKWEFSLAMLDVDHFKGINDRYGHRMGDRVLQALADLLRERGRKSDVVARYGGDEIAIIMPESAKGEAVATLSRLQEEFGRRKFRPDSAGEPFQVSFSAGVSSFPEDGRQPDLLIQGADEALYRAKRAGRARVIPCQGPPEGDDRP